jgi:hypothetical protein
MEGYSVTTTGAPCTAGNAPERHCDTGSNADIADKGGGSDERVAEADLDAA